jgi:hypothetical protein
MIRLRSFSAAALSRLAVTTASNETCARVVVDGAGSF